MSLSQKPMTGEMRNLMADFVTTVYRNVPIINYSKLIIANGSLPELSTQPAKQTLPVLPTVQGSLTTILNPPVEPRLLRLSIF